MRLLFTDRRAGVIGVDHGPAGCITYRLNGRRWEQISHPYNRTSAPIHAAYQLPAPRPVTDPHLAGTLDVLAATAGRGRHHVYCRCGGCGPDWTTRAAWAAILIVLAAVWGYAGWAVWGWLS